MLVRVVAAVLGMALFSTTAIAHPSVHVRHHKSTAHHQHRSHVVVADPGCNIIFPCDGVAPSKRGQSIADQFHFGSPQQVYTPARHRIPRAVPSYGAPTPSLAWTARHSVESTVVEHPAGCPRTAFCGCGTAVRLLGAPFKSLWAAASWYVFPKTDPAPNMAGVRPHHVLALIEHRHGNVWLVYDPNSGRHLTRIHEVDISRYRIVNPHGSRRYAGT